MIPQSDDGAVLYVQEPGSHVGKRSEHLVVRKDGQEVTRVPMHAIRQLVVCGNVQVSTQALETLAANEIPVAYLTGHGRFIGTFAPAEKKNVGLREAQFRRFADAAECLSLSKAVVRGKLTNQRALLMRSLRGDGDRGSDEPAAQGLADLIRPSGRGGVGGDGAGSGGPGRRVVLRRVRPVLAGPAAGPRLRVHVAQPPAAARPGERAAVVRLRHAGEGLFRRGLHGGIRPVQGILPRQSSRQAVAGVGPDGGVPPGDRRLRGADAHQQRDADAGRFRGLARGVPADGSGPADSSSRPTSSGRRRW